MYGIALNVVGQDSMDLMNQCTTTAPIVVRICEVTMIELLLAVIASAAILLLIGITVAEILEAKSMEWETRTIIRKEEEDVHNQRTETEDLS